jgi:hypothetical protein
MKCYQNLHRCNSPGNETILQKSSPDIDPNSRKNASKPSPKMRKTAVHRVRKSQSKSDESQVDMRRILASIPTQNHNKYDYEFV